MALCSHRILRAAGPHNLTSQLKVFVRNWGLGGHKGGNDDDGGHFICQDVRQANRLVTRLEELSACLETNKATASLELAEQKIRFKNIAQLAASRVETARDLLIRWQELTTSEDTDNLDFQPLTQFLKCYGLTFQ